ncbi:BAR domain-containing protein [Ceratocystis pirilliformis]|uniref:BAR domain-containing protein n=1 Tax=Ceratocystis pirilliformis TaxID=259994 RepID=A0ABR3ZNJ1_9PEZI
MDNFKNLGQTFSSFGAQITPFASRTFQYTKEQLGQAEDKTQLPPDYIDLEKRVDALKQVHQKMLTVTYVNYPQTNKYYSLSLSMCALPLTKRITSNSSQYSNEAYDYPPNIKETFQDLSRTVGEKVNLLSTATSPAEAQAALVAPPSAKPQPKTFNHAIARSSLSSSQLLHQQHTGAGEDPLATALEKYALAMERVGEARLAQDAQVQSHFLAGWTTTLNTNLKFAMRARKNVENSRLTLDAVKARVTGATWKLPVTGTQREPVDENELSPEAQEEIEKAEDEFVTQTEEAVGVMKNVLDTPEPLRNLLELVTAQMDYHKKAYDILSELAPIIEGLQAEQESAYRQNRESAA